MHEYVQLYLYKFNCKNCGCIIINLFYTVLVKNFFSFHSQKFVIYKIKVKLNFIFPKINILNYSVDLKLLEPLIL